MPRFFDRGFFYPGGRADRSEYSSVENRPVFMKRTGGFDEVAFCAA